jgi:hypothetical protein
MPSQKAFQEENRVGITSRRAVLETMGRRGSSDFRECSPEAVVDLSIIA